MKHLQNEKGFTLVELAIVMTIIGLLIGGVLKGQELMENARVTSTISQVKGYEGAVTTFRDTYNYMPGDMPNAASRLPDCAGCNAAGATLGDGLVGVNGGLGLDNSAVTTENTLFWTHLLKANLIAGVTDAAISGGTVQWGETHPSAPVGGGFTVGYGTGGARAAWAGGTMPLGNNVTLRSVLTGSVGSAANQQALSPMRAAQIDRKMDDGISTSGSVVGYGVAASCSGGLNGSYDETVESKDCGLAFKLQN